MTRPFSVPTSTCRAAAVLLAIFAVGCSGGRERSQPVVDAADIQAARDFEAYPLYWLGDRFEGRTLSHIQLSPVSFTTFVYGTCTPTGEDHPTCSPPLQVQVQPLCAHLRAVAQAPIWRRRQVRGAPVGTIDSAPVLFSRGAQVKVYSGEEADPGLRLRALRALRSVNEVQPVVGPREPIPPPPPGVLDGSRRCR